MKKITPRIKTETSNFLEANFKTINAGAEHLLNSAPQLFKRVTYHFGNLFSDQELFSLQNSSKNFPLSPALAGQLLFFSYKKKDALREKLKKLSLPELFFLEIYLKNIEFEEVGETTE